MTTLAFTADKIAITVRSESQKTGFFSRLVGKAGPRSIDDMSREDRDLAVALSDLKALAEEEDRDDELEILEQSIVLSHELASSLDTPTANALGLPPLTDLVFATSVAGVLGEPSFRLNYQWTRGGKVSSPRRTGSILHTADGDRRLSRPLYDAIAIAENFGPESPLAEHWSALARFRRSLRPEDDQIDQDAIPDATARIEMMTFLDTLRIRNADAFSLSLRDDEAGGVTFDPAPFSRETLTTNDGNSGEEDARLSGRELARFQSEFEKRGANNAYQLSDNSYLVVEPSAAPALEVMAQKQKASPSERAAFIENPAPALTEAYEKAIGQNGQFDGESDASREAIIEAAVSNAFIETREYLSARVLGIGTWRPPDIGDAAINATTWLPELFTDKQRAAVEAKPSTELQSLEKKLDDAERQGRPEIVLNEDISLPVNAATRALIKEAIVAAEEKSAESPSPPDNEATDEDGPVVIKTLQNFDSLTYGPELRPRLTELEDQLPDAVTAKLMEHQDESFAWQLSAWRSGLPGILNADEPGLGKTLQTLSFLAWLRKAMAKGPIEKRLPILIVAPTTLLENWEKEVGIHLDKSGLGFVERLYGTGVSSRKRHGSRGKDIDDGSARLDFGALEEAIEEGRGHGRWLLTTYQTLTNYQHSFARLRFSAAVFDEIQAVKNPATLTAEAVRSVAADFRIGLTGTPVENRLTDLWAILDQLAPGALASLAHFRRRFEPPAQETMDELHSRIFAPSKTAPPLGIRRLKVDVAADLPPKQRLLHPRRMPLVQADRYLEAHDKAASASRGGALKALQHIRSVSAHPGMEIGDGDTEFVNASARLIVTIDLLHWIKSRNERALVFIEHAKLQHRFADIVRRTFSLDEVPIINGKTPAKKRQPIVDHFQRHLKKDGGFDVLILAPRAAGTGLTLTAACHVIHLSRWWNPAVEEQCNDRTHRIGQTEPVTVHIPMAIHPDYITASFDCLLHNLMRQKRHLASAALWPAGDSPSDIGEIIEQMASSNSAKERTFQTDNDALLQAISELNIDVQPLANGSFSLQTDKRSLPIELHLGNGPNQWSLDRKAAARIMLGSSNNADSKGDPPTTILDADMVSLWPQHAIDV